jgi:hypothetical protein
MQTIAQAGSLPAREIAGKVEATMPQEKDDACWGDRFAAKVCVVCFLLLALMTAYDLITGLLRGSGSN